MATETTYTNLRQNLAAILDKVVDDQEPVIVRRRVLASLQPARPLHELPMPLFRLAVKTAQARGIAADLTDAAVARMREDLVFNLAPAQRDFGYAPRAFRPEARMFERAVPARD